MLIRINQTPSQAQNRSGHSLFHRLLSRVRGQGWIPACAGMTGLGSLARAWRNVDSRLRGNDEVGLLVRLHGRRPDAWPRPIPPRGAEAGAPAVGNSRGQIPDFRNTRRQLEMADLRFRKCMAAIRDGTLQISEIHD